MSLRIEAAHTAGEFTLDVHLSAGSGLTALVGPSGSGKTTLLNVVAGVLRPDRGLVRLEGETLAGHVIAALEAASRAPNRIRLSGAPALSAHDRSAEPVYGRWFRRHVKGGPAPDDVIGLLDLGSLLGRRPTQLSGGEKQRVALGRALLARPKLLLFDEPLASIDQAIAKRFCPTWIACAPNTRFQPCTSRTPGPKWPAERRTSSSCRRDAWCSRVPRRNIYRL